MFSSLNSKKQGDIGLGAAISHFVKNEYTVSIPLTDSQDYDLIVDKDNEVSRVQVKTTGYKKDDIFVVHLSVKGGNRSGKGKVKKFDNTKVEYVFALTSDNEEYLIPSKEIDTKNQITLGVKYERFKMPSLSSVVGSGRCKRLSFGT